LEGWILGASIEFGLICVHFEAFKTAMDLFLGRGLYP